MSRWLLFTGQAWFWRAEHAHTQHVRARIADRDVHGRTPRNHGPGWRVLMNDEAVLVGGAEHPPDLADPQANGGEFPTSGCLPAVLGPKPQQVRHAPIVGVTPNAVADREPSSDQDHDDEREHHTTHNGRIRRVRSPVKGPERSTTI